MLWKTRITAVVLKLHVSLEHPQPQHHPVLPLLFPHQGNLPDFESQRKTQDYRLKEVILICLIIFNDIGLF